MKEIELIQGDCLEVMDRLIEQGVKVDAIIADPPYGITACKWDSIIPFNRYIEIREGKGDVTKIVYEDEAILHLCKQGMSYEEALKFFNSESKEGMWERLNKLIKSNGAIVLFGSEPFSSALRMSNIKNYKYDWIWEKVRPSNPMLAKKQPLRYHELTSVFYSKQCLYNPQKTKGKNNHKNGKFGGNHFNQITQTESIYLNNTNNMKYPKTILRFKSDTTRIHPTQKPIALMEYLIKTYTNEGETILDFTMGSGSTGVACKNLNRKFIGIELDEKYFEIANKRINEPILNFNN